jgi:hypothetical protein
MTFHEVGLLWLRSLHCVVRVLVQPMCFINGSKLRYALVGRLWCYAVHIKFHQNSSAGSKVARETETLEL